MLTLLELSKVLDELGEPEEKFSETDCVIVVIGVVEFCELFVFKSEAEVTLELILLLLVAIVELAPKFLATYSVVSIVNLGCEGAAGFPACSA